MAIVKMQRLRVLALRQDAEQILRLLQRMGCVEITDHTAASETQDIVLKRPDASALTAARETMTSLQGALGLLKARVPGKKGLFRIRPEISEGQLFDDAAYASAKDLAAEANGCARSLAALNAEKLKLNAKREELAPWLPLDVPLTLTQTERLRFRFGTLPAAVPLTEAEAAVGELGILYRASLDREFQYLLLVCHAEAEESALNALRGLGWTRVALRDCCGTAQATDAQLRARLAEIERERAEEDSRLNVCAQRCEELYLALDRAGIELQREENRQKLAETEKTIYFEGWVSGERWIALRGALDDFACAYEVSEPEESEYGEVPVQLKDNALTEPLNMVTEMYSLPAYGTLDPNPLMAPFFVLFYGIMMADMGYGLLMILAALVIRKKYKPKGGMGHFFMLLLECGVSTFLFGALTGGFFGDFLTQLVSMLRPGTTFALPKLFDPLDDIMAILIGSLCLGAVQIITGMAISFIEKCRRGKYLDALFEEVTWWIVFAGGALAVLGKTMLVLWFGCALVLLGPLVQGKGMGKLTGIFSSLYNHVTGYFSDVLSYSRLMALMLAGSVIAQVFNMLGTLPGSTVLFILIAMVGNALNFGLNLLSCYVHDLRLQCLEFFGKFYVDGGRPFRPLTYQTKYVDIE